MMEEEVTCPVCDTICTISHEEADTIEYCPFCGNLLEEELDGFESIDEDPYED
jgi:hypothetical protein